MTPLNTIIEEEKKDYAVIKHIAEIADKHCPDLGVEHQATPAIDIINRFVTTAMQRAYEVGREENPLKGERRRIIEQIREERDAYWKERVEAVRRDLKARIAHEDYTECVTCDETLYHLDTLLDNLK